MIIAIDYDGVIQDDNGFVEGGIECMQYLQSKGHKLILWTCKSERYLSGVIALMAEYNIIFDAVNACSPMSPWYSHPKIYADIYIDDKSFPSFSGWKSFKKYIDEVK